MAVGWEPVTDGFVGWVEITRLGVFDLEEFTPWPICSGCNGIDVFEVEVLLFAELFNGT